jgi:hypothetical protein
LWIPGERVTSTTRGLAWLAAGVASAAIATRAAPAAARTLGHRARPGHAPHDPDNYATGALVLYPNAPTSGNTTVDSDGVVHVHRTPRGPRFKVANLPPAPTSFCEWVADSRALLAAAGVVDPTQQAFIVAHWDRETGAGRYQWNFNFGNEKQYDQYRAGGAWHRLTDGEAYRTYASAAEGVAGNLSILRSIGHGAPWRKLLAGDPSWYGDLGRAHYYGDVSEPAAVEAAAQRGQAEFDEYLARVRSCT